MNIRKLYNEIYDLEERLQNLSISDTKLIKLEIEIELGEKYKALMNWVESNNIKKIFKSGTYESYSKE